MNDKVLGILINLLLGTTIIVLTRFSLIFYTEGEIIHCILASTFAIFWLIVFIIFYK